MASIYVDVDLDEFDDDDIIRDVKLRIKDKHTGAQFKEKLLDEISIQSIREINASVTIRDEQYEEVFEKLKQQYSVPELEKLLK